MYILVIRFNNCVSFIICCLGLATPNLSAPSLNNVGKRSVGTIDNRTMVIADTSTQRRFSLSSRYQRQVNNNFDSRKHIDGSLNSRSLDNISKRSQLVDSPELEEIIMGKRQDCVLPKNMVQDVSAIYWKLNNTFLIGGNQGPSVRKTQHERQLLECIDWRNLQSTANLNSRTICPWLLTELDVGNNTYPRYFEEATCICRQCMGAIYSYCTYGYQTIRYFKFGGCLNGFAVLQRKTMNIRSHCFCDRPEPGGRNTPVPNISSEK